MTNLTYPQPAELTPEQIEERKIAHRLGQAVADQHRGVSIVEHVVDGGFLLDISHVAHNWSLKVDRAETDSPTTLEQQAKRKAAAHYLIQWHRALYSAQLGIEATNAAGEPMIIEHGLIALIELMRRREGKFVFVGNGGSSAIAGHMAEDFTKNGKVRALTFNDPALLTCYANDYGWDMAYAHAVQHHGEPGDVLVAISSSGKSASIVNAAMAGRERGLRVVTLSGFAQDNPLRKLGLLNFWVPSHQYGFVETAHAAWLHAALDMHMGWVGQQ